MEEYIFSLYVFIFMYAFHTMYNNFIVYLQINNNKENQNRIES